MKWTKPVGRSEYEWECILSNGVILIKAVIYRSSKSLIGGFKNITIGIYVDDFLYKLPTFYLENEECLFKLCEERIKDANYYFKLIADALRGNE